MRSLRIQGLVRLADRVRRELAQPISPAGRDQLRSLVADAVRQVDRILADHQMTIDRLPSPTRRAYDFLKNLDFDGIAVEANGAESGVGNVGLVGLKSFWETTFHRLAHAEAAERLDALHQGIASTNRNVEQFLDGQGVRVRDLTATTRSIRGWLAFFAERANFDHYIDAVRLAKPLFDDAMQQGGKFHRPAFIHFRPTNGLYRIHGYRDGTRVNMPTLMIAFSQEDFVALANAVFNGGPKQPVLEALASEECQAIRAELEALGGIVEQTTGLHRDLAAAYERVRQRYFDNTVPRPRLTWSRSFTGRKFGHYDQVRDTVMISASLDRTDVPECVVDFVMYHELLHKKLGLDWRCGRAHAHTPQFREEERRFERFAESEAVLKRLATAPGAVCQ